MSCIDRFCCWGIPETLTSRIFFGSNAWLKTSKLEPYLLGSIKDAFDDRLARLKRLLKSAGQQDGESEQVYADRRKQEKARMATRARVHGRRNKVTALSYGLASR